MLHNEKVPQAVELGKPALFFSLLVFSSSQYLPELFPHDLRTQLLGTSESDLVEANILGPVETTVLLPLSSKTFCDRLRRSISESEAEHQYVKVS